MNKALLHMEGLAVLLVSVYFYASLNFSWLLFIVLFFIPDVSMVGYGISKKFGALTYNIFHTYTVPTIFILMGVFSTMETLVMIGLIWSAHIGMDRMIGYGLKYPTSFKETHLNRV
ncbi:DUF4260 domain-containing protein [Salirhabdus salicampi]|uniref:DUF4260 domain-containing protein n=1 Tax=Salirhabdus salicampi TaxID=476102 RepID=UPI0020C4781A|nr:DUF4260 domain-containing protein [Salirhabdus salicampi]MCP8615881.1 DUF4260 domain-containing protein [Salirhabdus salicampi]